MKLILLLAVLPLMALSCANGFDPWLDGRCFRIYYFSRVDYPTAFEQCKRANARLPSIKTQEEAEKMFAALKRNNYFESSSFWLSLTCDGAKFVWADGTEATCTNFAANYNCTSHSKDRHYYIGNDRLWHETDQKSFYYPIENIICEGLQPSSSLCDDYDLLKTDGSTDTCYKLNEKPATWYQAEESCREEGAHIAVIRDAKNNELILQSAVAANIRNGMHIGLRKDDISGNYTCTDGSAIDYDNFVPGFPNDDYGSCVAMQTGFLPGKWMNVDCYYSRLPYVCAKPAFIAANPQPAGCPAKTQYAPGDEIFSPGFPNAPGVSDCQYLLLEPSKNKKASIEISFFESNSCCDSLTIYDGLFGSRILKTLTGFLARPLTIRASSNAIRLVWNATSGSNVRGFHAKMSSCC